MLLMLEDNAERLDRFTAVLRHVAPALPFQVWRDARLMIQELEAWLPQAKLISLDHDLDPLPGNANDPGTGLDLARFLGTMSPRCPVNIHTSNSDRAHWMAGLLELGGWEHRRVAPFDDDWIESDWRDQVRDILNQHP